MSLISFYSDFSAQLPQRGYINFVRKAACMLLEMIVKVDYRDAFGRNTSKSQCIAQVKVSTCADYVLPQYRSTEGLLARR